MKILAIDHLSCDPANRRIYDFISNRHGVNLKVIAPSNWIENYKYYGNKNSDTLKIGYELIYLNNYFPGKPHLMFYTFKLYKIFKNFLPDIIYVNAEPENILMLQVILFAKIYSPKSKIIFVTWRNIKYELLNYPYKLQLIHRIVEKITYKFADACRSFNPTGKELLANAGFKKRIDVIPWGIDTDLYFFKNTEKKDSELTLGYVGRFVKPKGLEMIALAIYNLRKKYPVKGILVGDGPIKKDLLKTFDRLNISNHITIVNTVKGDEIVSWLHRMDIFLLPSYSTKKWKEQFGRVLVEAMSAGIPVVGSSSGEIPWVIGNSGLVFREGDQLDMEEKISELICDYKKRDSFSILGRESVIKRFEIKLISERLLNFLGEILYESK